MSSGKSCRACGTGLLIELFDFGLQPVCSRFLASPSAEGSSDRHRFADSAANNYRERKVQQLQKARYALRNPLARRGK